MPFAEQSGLITALLQQFGKRRLIGIKTVSVVHETIFVTVFASQNNRSTRSTNRIGTKTIFKEHPFPGKLIDMGRGIDAFVKPVIGTNGVRRMIVGKYE